MFDVQWEWNPETNGAFAGSRDVAQQAALGEMQAKVRLHETVEGQLESQMLRSEEERLAQQRKHGEQLARVDARRAEEAERAAALSAELEEAHEELRRARREIAAERAKGAAAAEAARAEVEASAGEVGAVRQAPALSCGAGGRPRHVHDMSHDHVPDASP